MVDAIGVQRASLSRAHQQHVSLTAHQ
uniref:Uncharacterized protein n=1 Tax=Arundo donax TaxID=35708 RepID=A0A0A9G856_ARUDO